MAFSLRDELPTACVNGGYTFVEAGVRGLPNESGAGHTFVVNFDKILSANPSWLTKADVNMFVDGVISNGASFDYTTQSHKFYCEFSGAARSYAAANGGAQIEFEYTMTTGYSPDWEVKTGNVLFQCTVGGEYSIGSLSACSPPVTYSQYVADQGGPPGTNLYPIAATLSKSANQRRVTFAAPGGVGGAVCSIAYTGVNQTTGAVTGTAANNGTFYNTTTDCIIVRAQIPPVAIYDGISDLTPYKTFTVLVTIEENILGVWTPISSGTITGTQEVIRNGYAFQFYSPPALTTACINCGPACPQAYDVRGFFVGDPAYRLPSFGCQGAQYDFAFTTIGTIDVTHKNPASAAHGILTGGSQLSVVGGNGAGAATLSFGGTTVTAGYASTQHLYPGWGYDFGYSQAYYQITGLQFRGAGWPSTYSFGVTCDIYIYNTAYGAINETLHAYDPGLPYYYPGFFQNGYYPQ